MLLLIRVTVAMFQRPLRNIHLVKFAYAYAGSFSLKQQELTTPVNYLLIRFANLRCLYLIYEIFLEVFYRTSR